MQKIKNTENEYYSPLNKFQIALDYVVLVLGAYYLISLLDMWFFLPPSNRYLEPVFQLNGFAEMFGLKYTNETIYIIYNALQAFLFLGIFFIDKVKLSKVLYNMLVVFILLLVVIEFFIL